MAGFVVTAVFVLDGDAAAGGKAPYGGAVLAAAWGPGHRFSYSDGHTLTLVVELEAAHEAAAFEQVLGRAEAFWTAAGGAPLPPPRTLRVRRVDEALRVAAGAGPRRTAEGFARPVAVSAAPMGDPLVRGRGPDVRPGEGDDGFDDGGLAGVREPRRPGPGPGHLQAARDLPRAVG